IAHNWLLGMAGVAVQLAYAYRLAAVHNKSHIIQSTPCLLVMVLIQLSYTLPCATITLLLHKPEDELLEFIQENYAEIADFYATNSCSIITTDKRAFLPYIVAAFCLLSFATVSGITLMTLLLRTLAKLEGQIASKNLEMHRSLTRALILQ
ncbi:hypothetical protein AAVH_33381, partial [Aphelenchoides avenae]